LKSNPQGCLEQPYLQWPLFRRSVVAAFQRSLTRVLPVFEGINEEAHALERRRDEELMSGVSTPEEDTWDVGEAMADLAFNEAT
jgi:hypothetical protein